MNTTRLLTMGLLLGSALTAAAQDGPKPQGPPPDVIAKFDKDGDGKLSPEEREAMREARKGMMEKHRKEMLGKYDADKDGKLSKEERRKMHEERQAAMIRKFDKDGDGKLSDEERAAMPKPPRKGHGPGPHGPGPDGHGPHGPGPGGPAPEGPGPDGPPPMPDDAE